MFKRKRVQPSIHEYILRRYDDIAVRINADIRSGRDLQNYYIQWLEGMLEGFPEAQRNKYSLLTAKHRPVLSAWAEEPDPDTEKKQIGRTGRSHVSPVQGSENSGLVGRSYNDRDNSLPTEEIINTHSKFCVVL